MVELGNKYKKNLGSLGEDLARQHFLKLGFKIMDKNIVSWGGEIDFVAEDKGVLHIVEVKTSKSKINPLEHLNIKKLQTLKRAAEHYVNFKLKTKLPFVITVVAVWLNFDGTLKNIEILENIEI